MKQAVAATATTLGAGRYVRYEHQGRWAYGLWEADSVREIEGDIFGRAAPSGRKLRRSDVRFLVPTLPSKVIAVGLNYASHRVFVEGSEGVFVTITGRPVATDRPVVFAKFPSSLIADGDEIVLPKDSTSVHFEGELVLVVGRQAKDVTSEDAIGYVFGVTVGNDLVDRGWLQNDLQWFRAKGSDGFGPVGPAIVSGIDYSDLKLETRVNGEVRQSARTSELVFSPDQILSFCSRYVTLMPGDLIFTGTPGETQAVERGDTIEVEIEGVGVLRNRIAG